MPATKSVLVNLAYAAFIIGVLIIPLFLDGFDLNRIAKWLIYAILAIAISLTWGYAGILNLGQGLFFGIGAYMLGMSLKLASPTSLAQGADTPVPDFMLWNAEPGAPTELCCINSTSFLWQPFINHWFGIAMGVILPAVVAFCIGMVVFRKRISGVFTAVITLAVVLLVRLLVIDAQPLTNGYNGLTDLAYLTIGGIEFDPYATVTYYLVAISLVVILIAARLLTESRTGQILQAIRDDDNRARFLGFDVPVFQTFFFSISALIAGYAGMLYVVVAEFASPTFMDLTFSITMVVWAAVGGRSSLLGVCIGALLINAIETSVSETDALVEAWKIIIGLIFVFVVLFMPQGIAGLANSWTDRILEFLRNSSTRVNKDSRQPAE